VLAALSGFVQHLAAQTAADQPEAAEPTITFVKDFPGSYPAYYSISLSASGAALYRTAPDEKPTVFQVSETTTQQIFALGERMDYFRSSALESKRKVAQMGKKTFAYDNAGEHQSVTFNHTENSDGLALLALFEKLSSTQRHRDHVEYLLRFDRLGIVKELLQLEVDLDDNQLLEPMLLLPVLEKVKTNRALVNVAQGRAATIIAKIEAAKQ
jgi:hypothetical protein